MGVFSVVAHEVRILLRDPMAIVGVYVVLPLVFIVFTGEIFARSFGDDPRPLSAQVSIAAETEAGLERLGDILRAAGATVRPAQADDLDRVAGGLLGALIREGKDGRLEAFVDPGDPGIGPVLREVLVLGLAESSTPPIRIVRAGSGRSEDPVIASVTLPGFTVMFAFFAMGGISLSFYRERYFGTWRRLCSLPLSWAEIVVGKLCTYALLVVIQFVVLLSVGYFFLGVELGRHPWLLLPVVTAIAAASSGIGALLMTATRTQAQANVATNLLVPTLAFLGGAIVPLNLLPSWAQALAPATPHYWAMTALLDVMLRDASAPELIPALSALILFAIAGSMIAIHSLRLENLRVM